MDGGGRGDLLEPREARRLRDEVAAHRVLLARERAVVRPPPVDREHVEQLRTERGQRVVSRLPRGTGARMDVSVLTAAANAAAQQPTLRFRRALRLAEPSAQARCNTRAARRRL
jgi:hypothetical protein